jgi:hypothetical protein
MRELHHTSRLLPGALLALGQQPGPIRTGLVTINSLSESPEVLLGLLGQGVGAGLIGSMGEISVLCLNGRRIPMVGR